ncbi:ribonuclease R family protein, partial [Bryobacter aggregatus]|uniref:ribonuclease R family protein n=1 Tax=Bryobacter aggregatus TaxID=360054 RepID=UPI0004E16582
MVVKDEALLAHINRLPNGRTTLRNLTRELGSKGMRREEVERSVQRLARKGLLVELRNNTFQLASKAREFSAGTLRMHRDGFGFVILDQKPEGLEGDIFINQDDAHKAMHGDRVLVRIGRIGRDGKANGDIVRVLHRANQQMVGEFRITRRGNFVVPYDQKIKQWIEIPEGMELPPPHVNPDRVGQTEIKADKVEDINGMMVTVEVLDFPDEDANGVGRVIELLGFEDDFGVDVEIMIRKHHLPHHFPQAVLEEAHSMKRDFGPAEWEGRTDFRDYDIVTIDGESARDFDDAVWVEKLPDQSYKLQVHIADVSWYIRPGSAIDEEAMLRGTSVYFPDRAVPMLPIELSTDLCSLRPNEERLVLSALLHIDHKGQVLAQDFTRGVIRSRERMTYTNVYKLLEGTPEEQADLRDRYAPLVERFELMKELALVLNRMRSRRGSIDFDLPEPIIEFDTFGEMVGVSRGPRNIAHRLIEELMLAANEAVATHLQAKGIPSLYRIHEQPDAKRVAEFEEAASKFGVSLGMGAVPVKKYRNTQSTRDGRKIRRDIVINNPTHTVTSKNYQKLVAKIEGKPEERIVSYLMLRSLKQARYSNDNVGHFALAAPAYTHFTSPIRRYPDLIVHRILTGMRFEEEYLKQLGEDTSFSERRAAEAERELVEWKKMRFMSDRVGDHFHAMIISTTKFGFFIELEELFIEGLVPIDSLPKDRYMYNEFSRKIVGERSKRAFSVGDKVQVALVKVDLYEKRLSFMLVTQ